jgi:protein-S-isoprenylcysteine O-methyltransferase Ste14
VTFDEELYRSLRYYLPWNSRIAFTTGQWHLVGINALAFIGFLVPLSFRRKARWGEMGIVTAFFVSLFVEMYGVPLSILALYKYLEVPPIHTDVSSLYSFSFFGAEVCIDHVMAYGGLLILIGTALVAVGWSTLYRNIRQGGLVTRGVYRHSRHPQYFGFILVLAGWLLGWPSLVTIAFVPLLIYKYVAVCRAEEREMLQRSPGYLEYMRRVPFLV